ncbi:MAG: hypothetical protein ABIJ95_08110 [Pseudomonadota bacterium]
MKKTRAKTSPRAVPESRYREQYGVIVICGDEKEQKRVYEELSRKGLKTRVVVT